MLSNEGRFRYERKFVVADQCRTEVEQLIKRHPANFHEIFHQREINNIYFDTADCRHLRDSQDGATNRLKIRIRWYGQLFDNVKSPVLELKRKHGLMVSKDSFHLPSFEASRGMCFDHVNSLLRDAKTPESVRHETCRVKPVLVNRYRRKYFLSADKRYRVTVDDGLSYYPVRLLSNSFLSRTTDDRHIIVEVKYGIAHDQDADLVSGHFPFRLSRWSKFVAGLEEGYED